MILVAYPSDIGWDMLNFHVPLVSRKSLEGSNAHPQITEGYTA
jgi:hypothetical protein